MILVDNETSVDLLNNEAISKTVCSLLDKRRGKPLTIGVHGDWGAGKSSILEMIYADKKEDSDTICIRFNGWRYQGFEDAKIALIEGVMAELKNNQSFIDKVGDGFKKLWKRVDWLKAAKHAGGLAFTVATGVPSPEIISAVIGGVKSFVEDPAKSIGAVDGEKLISDVSSYFNEAESKNGLAFGFGAALVFFGRLENLLSLLTRKRLPPKPNIIPAIAFAPHWLPRYFRICGSAWVKFTSYLHQNLQQLKLKLRYETPFPSTFLPFCLDRKTEKSSYSSAIPKKLHFLG